MPHQADTIRLLGDGKITSLRATVGQWADWRPKTPGFYTALMQFDNGAVSQMTYNGYGYFLTQELVDWSSDRSLNGTPAERGVIRQALRDGSRPRGRAERPRSHWRRRPASSARRAHKRRGRTRTAVGSGQYGLVLVSCDKGDMRYSRYGIAVYSDSGREEQAVEEPYLPGREDLNELYRAAVHNSPVFHDGRWGMATLEISLAMMQSSEEQKEVLLTHQVRMPDEYDPAR